MDANALPTGSFVRIGKSDLSMVISKLRRLGYRTIGPRLSDGAIIYDDVNSVEDLPIGIVDRQDGGKYRVEQDDKGAYFDYVVGPHSLKGYLFPAHEVVLEC